MASPEVGTLPPLPASKFTTVDPDIKTYPPPLNRRLSTIDPDIKTYPPPLNRRLSTIDPNVKTYPPLLPSQKASADPDIKTNSPPLNRKLSSVDSEKISSQPPPATQKPIDSDVKTIPPLPTMSKAPGARRLSLQPPTSLQPLASTLPSRPVTRLNGIAENPKIVVEKAKDERPQRNEVTITFGARSTLFKTLLVGAIVLIIILIVVTVIATMKLAVTVVYYKSLMSDQYTTAELPPPTPNSLENIATTLSEEELREMQLIEDMKEDCFGKKTGTYVKSHDGRRFECRIGAMRVFYIDGNLFSHLNRSINEYRDGFEIPGALEWAGLRRLHTLTTNRQYKLTVWVYGDEELGGGFDLFRVGSEVDGYELTVAEYVHGRGTRGFINENFVNQTHFGTYDMPDESGCATRYGAGWWWSEACGAGLHNFIGRQVFGYVQRYVAPTKVDNEAERLNG